jgi:2-dehydro-3-deoxy-D-gluconate 5-dehydrogenase
MNEEPREEMQRLDALPLLEGRVIVVTGASRGIGETIALRAAQAGAKVLAVSRSGTAPEHPNVEAFTADVCAEDAPEKIVEGARSSFGALDGLVNNAGVIHHVDCWEHGDAEWDELFETNLTAPFRLSQEVVRHWLGAETPGVILNMASIESEVACPRQAGYAATKGGIVGMTRSMAVDLSSRGIRVVALGPGYIDTEQATVDPDEPEEAIPAGRTGKPDDVAGAALFLLSDLARYVTGTTLYVDGGYLAR